MLDTQRESIKIHNKSCSRLNLIRVISKCLQKCCLCVLYHTHTTSNISNTKNVTEQTCTCVYSCISTDYWKYVQIQTSSHAHVCRQTHIDAYIRYICRHEWKTRTSRLQLPRRWLKYRVTQHSKVKTQWWSPNDPTSPPDHRDHLPCFNRGLLGPVSQCTWDTCTTPGQLQKTPPPQTDPLTV